MAAMGTRLEQSLRLHTFRRKAQSFLRQPAFVKIWFVPLWFILGLSKALLFAVSFKRLAHYLGQSMGIFAWVPLVDTVQQEQAMQIGCAVRLAARYTPWDSSCFPQAMAARLLLGWYGVPYALCFGVMKDACSAELKAHAWVTAGRVTVTGGDRVDRFTVVSVFIDPRIACP